GWGFGWSWLALLGSLRSGPCAGFDRPVQPGATEKAPPCHHHRGRWTCLARVSQTRALSDRGPAMRAVLLALVLSFPGLPSVHAQEPDLVMGEVAVANRSEAVRVQSLPQVLAEAARRLTPDAAPQERVDLAAALEADPLLLHRFEYEQVIRPTSSGIPSIRLMLRGWFHVPRLRSLLVAHGIPVWPGGRVEGTLWLVEEGSEGRGLVDGSQPGLLDSLQAALHPRGVALLP